MHCCNIREIARFQDDTGGGPFDGACDLCAVVLFCGAEPTRLSSTRKQLEQLQPLSSAELFFSKATKTAGPRRLLVLIVCPRQRLRHGLGEEGSRQLFPGLPQAAHRADKVLVTQTGDA